MTVYFFNPNIHPEAEYKRREWVQQQFIAEYNEKTGHDVHFLAAPYEPKDYFEAVKGWKTSRKAALAAASVLRCA